MATRNLSYGAYTTMTITNIGIAPSLTAAWQSARVLNTSTKAIDYEILVYLAAVNTAPANDKTIYVYAVPWVNDDSTNYYPADCGNATLPTGSEGTISVGNLSSAPSNMKLLGVITNYTTNTVMSNVFNLKNAFGDTIPDGWSLVIVNYTGATLTPTGSIIAYRAITETIA
jgi:hypothetical protein